ncbi:MAG: hypothetical protein ACRD9R_08770 [Pyrinomonadaceae bacterium]
MATASTKSRARKQRGAETDTFETLGDVRAAAAGETGQMSPRAETLGAELSARAWFVACAVVIVAAAALRFYDLDLKPMHHDEGVNGFFLTNLLRSGGYRYDPANYHGPTLYYFTLPLAYVAERFGFYNTTLVRLVPALFGVATVWLVLALRRQLGMIGVLAAAALLAVSPGSVFFSRYYIHEMMFVFFTLGMVVAAVKFYEAQTGPATPDAARLGLAAAAAIMLTGAALAGTYRPGLYKVSMFAVGLSLCGLVWGLWTADGPRAWHWLLLWTSVALLFATKETAFISVGVLLIAWAMAWGYAAWTRKWGGVDEGRESSKKKRGKQKAGGRAEGDDMRVPAALVSRLGGGARLALLLVAGAGLFLFINVLYFSSFFTNPKGVGDALEAYAIWKKTGTSEFHSKPLLQYVWWLFAEEAPLVVLALVGAVFALGRAAVRRHFPLFAALWAGGMIAAYSLINYKTPWLALSMVLPLALAGGYAVQSLYEWMRQREQTFALTLACAPLALAAAICLYQTYQINFVHYDEDRYIYVYAHTSRQYDEMIRQIDRIAARSGKGRDVSINVASPDYWPMPWNMRDYKRVGYAGALGANMDQDIVIINATQAAQPASSSGLGSRYRRVGQYALRPGVELVLYAKSELAGM